MALFSTNKKLYSFVSTKTSTCICMVKNKVYENSELFRIKKQS